MNVAIPKSVRTLLWAAGLLLATEEGLRERAWFRHGAGGPVADIYQLDEAGHRRLKAGANLAGSERRVHINQLGFRGPEPLAPKPAGRVRIVALGDSTTFGMEARDDDAVWVSRLVPELEAATGGNFDAINAGVPGYTLTESAALLRDRIEPLEPDIVVVHQTATDIAANSRRQFKSKAETAGEPASSRFLESNSLLLNLLRVNASGLTARWLSPQRHDHIDANGVERYAAQLRELVAFCRERGWCIVLCTTARSFGGGIDDSHQFDLAASALRNNPTLSLTGLNDAFDRYNQAIREVAGQTGALMIDLDRAVPRGGDYFVDAVHFNDAGHRLVAQIIARELTKPEHQQIARGGN